MTVRKTNGKTRTTGTSTGKAKGKKGLPVLQQTADRMCLPAGGSPGGLAQWDGFNWVPLPPPTIPGSSLKWGEDGLYWASPD